MFISSSIFSVEIILGFLVSCQMHNVIFGWNLGGKWSGVSEGNVFWKGRNQLCETVNGYFMKYMFYSFCLSDEERKKDKMDWPALSKSTFSWGIIYWKKNGGGVCESLCLVKNFILRALHPVKNFIVRVLHPVKNFILRVLHPVKNFIVRALHPSTTIEWWRP